MQPTPPAPNHAELEAQIRERLKGQGFMHLIGADLTRIEPGRVEAVVTLTPQHQQQMGYAHGGLIATMADLTAGFASVALARRPVVTAELKVSYLNPGLGQQLRAVGWVLKAGRRLHFCEAEVWCGEVLVAKASATMALVEASPAPQP